MVKWRGGAWLDIKMNLMANFWIHLNGPLKSLIRSSFLHTPLLAKVKCFPFVSPKLGVLSPPEGYVNIVKCQKWDKTPYKTTSFRETWRITTNPRCFQCWVVFTHTSCWLQILCALCSGEPTTRFKSFMNHMVKVGPLAEKYNAVRHESDTLGGGDIMELS